MALGPPCPPKICFKIMQFSDNLKGKPLFWANLGLRAPLGSKLNWVPLTKILGPPLGHSAPFTPPHWESWTSGWSLLLWEAGLVTPTPHLAVPKYPQFTCLLEQIGQEHCCPWYQLLEASTIASQTPIKPAVGSYLFIQDHTNLAFCSLPNSTANLSHQLEKKTPRFSSSDLRIPSQFIFCESTLIGQNTSSWYYRCQSNCPVVWRQGTQTEIQKSNCDSGVDKLNALRRKLFANWNILIVHDATSQHCLHVDLASWCTAKYFALWRKLLEKTSQRVWYVSYLRA